MANTGFKGINVWQTGNQLVPQFSLKDSSGAKLATGTTVLRLMELQSDGTKKTYDFNDNTFKATVVTTGTLGLTHLTWNDGGTTSTGIWTGVISTLTGFTKGSKLILQASNSGASPVDQERMFQYGSAEGDLVVTDNGTGVGEMNSDLKMVNGSTISVSSGIITIGASALTVTVGTNNDKSGYALNSTQPAVAFVSLTVTGAFSINGTSNVAQTGDSFTRLGAPAGASVSADIAANLTAINNLNNLSALANIFGTSVLEIPDSGTTLYPFTLTIKNEKGQLVDVDSNTVTITAVNGAGTSRSGNLSATAHVATGRYTFTYGVTSAATEEGLRIDAAAAVSSDPRYAVCGASVVNDDSVTTLLAIKAKTDNLPPSPAAEGSAMTLADGSIKGTTFDATGQQLLVDSSTIAPTGQIDSLYEVTAMGTAMAAQAAINAGSANMAAMALPTATANRDTLLQGLIAAAATISGSTAAALLAAGNAGDPWSTILPGAYTSTQAGAILSTIATNTEGGLNVTVTPVTSTVSAGEVVSWYIVGYQNMAQIIVFTVVDGNGVPISLNGKLVTFTASRKYSSGNPPSPLITHDNSTIGGLTVTGASHNTVTVTISITDTETIDKLTYGLENTTDSRALGRGVYDIQPISQKIT